MWPCASAYACPHPANEQDAGCPAWSQVRRLGSGLRGGERKGWRGPQRFQNNSDFEMLDPGPFLAWGWRARGTAVGPVQISQPAPGRRWVDSPRP